MNQETFEDEARQTTPEKSASPAETETLPKQMLYAPHRDGQNSLIGMILHERYLIEKKLGDGGFGSVFLARDRRLMNKAVVVKILERSDNEWIWTKFQQEREALSRIEHPGVVGIQDAGELPDGQPFIVMQFVSGTTLRDALRGGEVPLNRVADITEQIAHALGAAHEKEILHRDLKPENIMLQPLIGAREQVKVIDFGIAKVRKSQVAESSTGLFSAGTLYYLPPESLQGKSYTIASDVYVLGVVVYEMLTGKRPFSPPVESPLLFAGELLGMQQRGALDSMRNIRPELPDAARRVLLRALDFEPSQRFQNAIEFGNEFASAIRNAQTFSPPPPAKTVSSTPVVPPFETEKSGLPTGKLPSRKRFVVGAAAVILLILLGASAFGVWYFNRSAPVISVKNETTAVSAQTPNSLRFWLSVQKMRDGKPFQEPFQSSGQEIFENGYKFQFNAASARQGFLYVFNEGTGDRQNKFWILFPTPKRNDGSAAIGANDTIQSGWNVFGGAAGTEKCWLIWTETENQTLEDARRIAFGSSDGSLSGESYSRLKEFIAANRTAPANIKKDAPNKQTIIESTDKISVNLVELEHR